MNPRIFYIQLHQIKALREEKTWEGVTQSPRIIVHYVEKYVF